MVVLNECLWIPYNAGRNFGLQKKWQNLAPNSAAQTLPLNITVNTKVVDKIMENNWNILFLAHNNRNNNNNIWHYHKFLRFFFFISTPQSISWLASQSGLDGIKESPWSRLRWLWLTGWTWTRTRSTPDFNVHQNEMTTVRLKTKEKRWNEFWSFWILLSSNQ